MEYWLLELEGREVNEGRGSTKDTAFQLQEEQVLANCCKMVTIRVYSKRALKRDFKYFHHKDISTRDVKFADSLDIIISHYKYILKSI